MSPAIVTPKSAACRATHAARALATSVLVGVHPLLTQVFEPRLREALAHAQLPAGVAEAVYAQRSKLGAIAPPAGAASAVAASVREAVGHAFVAGFRAAMLVSAGLALASALSAWWLISGRRPEPSSKGSTP